MSNKKINIELTDVEAKIVNDALLYYAANGNKDWLFSRSSGTVRRCGIVLKKLEVAKKEGKDE